MRKTASFCFFKRSPIIQKGQCEAWREVADILDFNAQERLRVEWTVFCHTVGKENATLTSRHFGISRKIFHKWLKRFKDSKYNVKSLADPSRAPLFYSKREVSLTWEERATQLRKIYPYYGKSKLKVIYEKEILAGCLGIIFRRRICIMCYAAEAFLLFLALLTTI